MDGISVGQCCASQCIGVELERVPDPVGRVQTDTGYTCVQTVFRHSDGYTRQPVEMGGLGTKRSIRTPFKVRPCDMWGPEEATLAEVVASFFQQSQANVSLLCECNGRVMDPNLTMKDASPEDVISFRVCPLLGGGKHDAVKTKVKNMLLAKGVLEDDAGDRVLQLFSKVPIEHVVKYKDDDDSQFWS